ncbi:MAG: tRNA (guanosine(46)-N7)-methyltransferase TrmB [Gammaproteobacteria bacterium]|nr:tRNA (guanosine(46)-N7)-methyltransferase TrmB [Gammaproteobacteria bacterium]
MMIPTYPLRRVRSFAKRDGRMTAAQKRVLTELWPQYGLDKSSGLADFPKIFGRVAPVVLEIGFGSGHSLLEIAKNTPAHDFIGIEMYQPGIGTLLLGIEAEQVSNIRIYYADAVEVLEECIPLASLDGIQLFFPDPWPKRKHHKRRIIQPDFVDLIVSKLKPAGVLHLATDWEHYALHMMQVLSNSDKLINLSGAGHFAQRSDQRPITTKFENRGTRSGRPIRELQFARCE